MTDREAPRPSNIEQQEAAKSVLSQAGFQEATADVLAGFPGFSPRVIHVVWDERGMSEIRGIKGKPNSAGLVILWGEERYPKIKRGEYLGAREITEGTILGITVGFEAAVIEANSDGTVSVKGKGTSRKGDWTDKDVRRAAIKHALEKPEHCSYLEEIPEETKATMIPYEPIAGMHVDDAAFRMVVLASNRKKTVVGSFNDIGITVQPGDLDTVGIVNYYHKESERRHREYISSPEAQHLERKEKAEEQRRIRESQRRLAKYPIVEVETKPQVGEMPSPRYLVDAPSTVSDGITRWIGIEGYGPDGNLNKMLWWRNFNVGDLNNAKTRREAAEFVVRLKLETEADVAIGPAIDLGKSSLETGHVEVVEEPGILAVYVEAEKRPMFNFLTAMGGVKAAAELRRTKRKEFDTITQKALEVLPYPTKTESASTSEI